MTRRPPRSTLFPYTTSSDLEDAPRQVHDPWPHAGDGFWQGQADEHESHQLSRKARGELLASERSEEHTSELQSRQYLVCRLLLEKKKKKTTPTKQQTEHNSN